MWLFILPYELAYRTWETDFISPENDELNNSVRINFQAYGIEIPGEIPVNFQYIFHRIPIISFSRAIHWETAPFQRSPFRIWTNLGARQNLYHVPISFVNWKVGASDDCVSELQLLVLRQSASLKFARFMYATTEAVAWYSCERPLISRQRKNSFSLNLL